MSRNSETFFSNNPKVNTKRSTFDITKNHMTTFNVGELVPFYMQEVIPGDTFKVQTNKLVRLQTLITPVMDDLYLDTYYFYVPCRLLWNHWKEFFGESSTAWTQGTEYTIPQIKFPTGTGWDTGSLADHFGIPTKVVPIHSRPSLDYSVNALPFRAYTKIVNDWFRDVNLQDEAYFTTGDETITGTNGSNWLTDIAKGGKPFIVNKYHDYFTSCLPAPQRGDAASAPVHFMGDIPVVSKSDSYDMNTQYKWYGSHTGQNNAMRWFKVTNAGGAESVGNTGYSIGYDGNNNGYTRGISSLSQYAAVSLAPANLYAIAQEVGGVGIPELRFAFQYQRYLETLARSGNRYIEIIDALYGVKCPDFRVQRSEYLGGNRKKLNISQVVQTSETSANSPQGNLTAYSCTGDSSFDFQKSFTEHGIVIGLMCVRYHHSYQNNIQRYWLKKEKTDIYMPVFANISEQPVYKAELYLSGSNVDQVFGYNEAWADYRFGQSTISGEFRSNAIAPLDMWHFADKYSTSPTLSSTWMQEDMTNVDRALAVSSSVSNQLMADIQIVNTATRPMPLHSIPGLADHH